MATAFRVVEHIIPGQHIREYPGGTRGQQEDLLRIAVKHYIPLQTPEPTPENAITIVGFHGNGFPKEIYEPYMADLCSRLQAKGVHVRGIWMADSCHQGASSVRNEGLIGDNTSWFDHSRDVLQMINMFRSEMPRPLIGIAHSFGCVQLVQLSLRHPRLLSTLILCEPVMMSGNVKGTNPALPSSMRRDLWNSHFKAETSLRRAFSTWDTRVLDCYVRHGLRAVPTLLYNPEKHEGVTKDSVTLTTSKHLEAWTFAQMNYEEPDEERDRLLRPDQDPNTQLKQLAARPECLITLNNLPFVRPSVLYVFGARSPVSPPTSQDEKVNTTGTGLGGSGGLARGKVQKVLFKRSGHLLPFEKPEELADTSADWIQKWFKQWLGDEEKIRAYKNPSSDHEGLRMSEDWIAAVQNPCDAPRPFRAQSKL